jgi:hypothetical protein
VTYAFNSSHFDDRKFGRPSEFSNNLQKFVKHFSCKTVYCEVSFCGVLKWDIYFPRQYLGLSLVERYTAHQQHLIWRVKVWNITTTNYTLGNIKWEVYFPARKKG